jgi:hypothetical protein
MAQGKINKLQKAQEVKCVALGEDVAEEEVVEVLDDRPRSDTERITALEQRIYYLTNCLDSLFTMVKEVRDDANKEEDHNLNHVIEEKKKADKVEIPEGTVLTGETRGLPYFLKVRDGGFYVGITKYDSLSAAAEGVSGVRRSGWTFWKLPDGKTVKEAFKG